MDQNIQGSADAEFRHQPLNLSREEIRLLQLLPSRGDDVVRCTLEHYEFNDHMPQHRALSYVWGKPTRLCQIQINERWFRVYPNLYDFLNMYHARVERPEHIWIDQICIDQSSDAEKSKQIGFMARIFKKTDNVICWLGRETAHGLLAMKLFNYARQHTEVARQEWHEIILQAFGRDGSGNLPLLSIEKRESLATSALSSFESNEYWSRLWVAQEVILAHNAVVFWGSSTTSLGRIRFFMDLQVTQPLVKSSPTPPLLYLLYRNERTPFDRPGSMMEAVTFLHEAGCSNPRDKVYAILSIIDPMYTIVVDYKKPVEEVLFDAMAAMVRRDLEPDPSEQTVRLVVQASFMLATQMLPERLERIERAKISAFMHACISKMLKPASGTTAIDASFGHFEESLQSLLAQHDC